jgi:ataxin-3
MSPDLDYFSSFRKNIIKYYIILYYIINLSSKDYIRRVNEGSGNVDAQGNFSIQVLRAALEQRYDLQLPSIGQDDLDKTRDITSYQGFICNKAAHWFAIRRVGTQFWNLNSLLKKPEAISHFKLAEELEALKQGGYSVFVIPKPLPDADRTTGIDKFWWRRVELEGGGGRKRSNMDDNEARHDWRSVGTGRRLDGRSGDAVEADDMQGLTEEEMMQRAIQASILPDVPEEPAAGAAGAVTIQFRFANGKRQVRRFLEDQPVQVVYAFCEQEMGGGSVELRYGFPPRNLSTQSSKTIGEAKLKGESIQARNV